MPAIKRELTGGSNVESLKGKREQIKSAERAIDALAILRMMRAECVYPRKYLKRCERAYHARADVRKEG